MSFNIEEFKANLSKGGLSKPYTFKAMVFGPASLSPDMSRDMQFRITSINNPGRSIQTLDRKISGPILKFGVDSILPELTLSIILSDDLREKLYFEKWQDKIVGNYRVTEPNQKMFELGFYEDYVGTVEVLQYDDTGKLTAKNTFIEAFPIQVGDIALSWEDNAQISRLNVTLHYKYFKDEI